VSRIRSRFTVLAKVFSEIVKQWIEKNFEFVFSELNLKRKTANGFAKM